MESSTMNLEEIQDQLRHEDVDGWLFFDHHLRDPIAYRVLSLDPPPHVSRRWYYWLPARGQPCKLVHRIESSVLDGLPGQVLIYSGWAEQHQRLREMLAEAKRVAMQYSPECMIPYISLVDAGTVELVRSLGMEVVSSASLVQYFESRWTPEQVESHFEAGRRVDAVRAAAFQEIGRRIRADGSVQELEIARFVRQQFADKGLVTNSGPIVATGANSSNPHYEPAEGTSSPIRAGDFVLIDMWAKLDQPRSVYYDITWTGYCGSDPPAEIVEIFNIVRGARDRALQFVRSSMASATPIAGYEVDDVARGYIAEHGLAEKFIHRTGHSIGENIHGNGANLDNLETCDRRPIIPRTCFSIEPGIYLGDFGVRSEINCYVSENDATATGQVQQELVCIG